MPVTRNQAIASADDDAITTAAITAATALAAANITNAAGDNQACGQQQNIAAAADVQANALQHAVLDLQKNQWRPQPPIPSYNGLLLEDPDAFLEETKFFFKNAGITSDATQLNTVGTFLTGAAAAWYRPYHGLLFNLGEFEERFREHFSGTATRRDLEIALYETRQERHESAETYLLTKRQLWRRLNTITIVDEAAATYAATRGLNDVYAARMYAENFKTFSDAIIKARKVETDIAPKQTPTTEQPRSIRPAAPITRNPTSTTNTAGPRRDQDSTERPLPRCWHCPGRHMNVDCPVRPKHPEPPGNGPPTSALPPSAGPAPM